MKILFLYRYLTVGGVETVLRCRLARLPEWGIEGKAYFLNDGPGRSMFSSLGHRILIGNLRDLNAYMTAEAPDLLVNIDTPEAIFAGTPYPIPQIVEVHTPYRENKQYLKSLHKYPISKILVPSHHQAREVRRRVRNEIPIAVVPNPLPEVFLHNQQTDLPQHPGKILAWIGRLDRLKNWPGFLQVASEVLKGDPSAVAWMVGEAPRRMEHNKFLREVANSGLAGRLRWFPRLSQQALALILTVVRDSGGVVISTSREESFGMTIAEAMARSCAVIVPDAGPFHEFVEDGKTGRLYDPEDFLQASNCALDLMSRAEVRLRMGDAGKHAILGHCDPKQSIGDLAMQMHQAVSDARQAA